MVNYYLHLNMSDHYFRLELPTPHNELNLIGLKDCFSFIQVQRQSARPVHVLSSLTFCCLTDLSCILVYTPSFQLARF